MEPRICSQANLQLPSPQARRALTRVEPLLVRPASDPGLHGLLEAMILFANLPQVCPAASRLTNWLADEKNNCKLPTIQLQWRSIVEPCP